MANQELIDKWIKARDAALDAVADERRNQFEASGPESLEYGAWSMIIAESFGLMAKSMLNLETPLEDLETFKKTMELRHNAIQLAAVASALVQQIDSGSS